MRKPRYKCAACFTYFGHRPAITIRRGRRGPRGDIRSVEVARLCTETCAARWREKHEVTP